MSVTRAVAVTMILRGGRMLLAHCGDARAIMGTLDDNDALVAVEVFT